MRKTKEARAEYMRDWRANRKAKQKTVEEQRFEQIGSWEDHCIDESIYDPNPPKFREGHEYTKQDIADNQEYVKQYLRKIGRF